MPESCYHQNPPSKPSPATVIAACKKYVVASLFRTDELALAVLWLVITDQLVLTPLAFCTPSDKSWTLIDVDGEVLIGHEEEEEFYDIEIICFGYGRTGTSIRV